MLPEDFVETGVNEEITTTEVIDDSLQLELLENIHTSIKTLNTLVLIMFIVSIAILIYKLMWAFIKKFI